MSAIQNAITAIFESAFPLLRLPLTAASAHGKWWLWGGRWGGGEGGWWQEGLGTYLALLLSKQGTLLFMNPHPHYTFFYEYGRYP